jgi:regulator of replication initiation timing
MQFDLFSFTQELQDDYDLRQKIWTLEEEIHSLKISMDKFRRSAFAQIDEMRKMYQELKEENAQLRFKIGIPQIELSKYELFSGERCG